MTEKDLDLMDKNIPEAYRIAQRNWVSWEELNSWVEESYMIVFAYGSLQLPHELSACFDYQKSNPDDDEVRYATRMIPGKLKGHKVHAIQDGMFPAILDDGGEEDVVEGMLIFGLRDWECHLLDRRQGEWYSREEKEISIVVGHRQDEDIIDAQVYMWARGRGNLIDPEEKKWSLREFVKARKQDPRAKPSADEDMPNELPFPQPGKGGPIVKLKPGKLTLEEIRERANFLHHEYEKYKTRRREQRAARKKAARKKERAECRLKSRILRLQYKLQRLETLLRTQATEAQWKVYFEDASSRSESIDLDADVPTPSGEEEEKDDPEESSSSSESGYYNTVADFSSDSFCDGSDADTSNDPVFNNNNADISSEDPFQMSSLA